MKRSFLFLQGPHGPFFRQLGGLLAQEGHDVCRINFHGGDVCDWLGREALDFRAPPAEWPEFCGELLRQRGISDLVLFGDCRPQHREAIAWARLADIRVHVFEEGYLRPDWITLEQNGVNGYSPLPKNADFYLEAAAALSEPHFETVGPAMRWQVGYCIRHYAHKIRLRQRFHHYLRHRPLHPLHETRLWLKRMACYPVRKRRTLRLSQELPSSGQPYYLACLQLDSDAQISRHSPFTSVAEFLSRVLRSFAAHAPDDTLLVFKNHPLDNGAVNYANLLAVEAHALGIGPRVRFLHYGNLPQLLRNAQGVVLANSTVGTSALFHGRPVITLGRAVYDFAPLTFQGELDGFWTQARPPDRRVFEAFRLYLLNRVLLNGSFYSPWGRHLALAAVMDRSHKRVFATAPVVSAPPCPNLSDPIFPPI